jgi:hypothetical protein
MGVGVEAFVCHVPDWAEAWVARRQRSTKGRIVLNMLFIVAPSSQVGLD